MTNTYRGYRLVQVNADDEVEIWYGSDLVTHALTFAAATQLVDDYHNAP